MCVCIHVAIFNYVQVHLCVQVPVCVIGSDLYLLSLGIIIGVGCSVQCLSGCLGTKVHPARTVTNKPFLQHTQVLHTGYGDWNSWPHTCKTRALLT